jgi:hypothetical protein
VEVPCKADFEALCSTQGRLKVRSMPMAAGRNFSKRNSGIVWGPYSSFHALSLFWFGLLPFETDLKCNTCRQIARVACGNLLLPCLFSWEGSDMEVLVIL